MVRKASKRGKKGASVKRKKSSKKRTKRLDVKTLSWRHGDKFEKKEFVSVEWFTPDSLSIRCRDDLHCEEHTLVMNRGLARMLARRVLECIKDTALDVILEKRKVVLEAKKAAAEKKAEEKAAMKAAKEREKAARVLAERPEIAEAEEQSEQESTDVKRCGGTGSVVAGDGDSGCGREQGACDVSEHQGCDTEASNGA